MKRIAHPFSLLAVLAVVAAFIPAVVRAAAVDVAAAENVKPALPVIPDRTFTLTDFGAVGDGRTLNTDAFKQAIAAIAQAGGGKLIVPRGVFRTTPFALCSNLDLHLAEGAVIQAPILSRSLACPIPRRSIPRTKSSPRSNPPCP